MLTPLEETTKERHYYLRDGGWWVVLTLGDRAGHERHPQAGHLSQRRLSQGKAFSVDTVSVSAHAEFCKEQQQISLQQS